MAIELIVAASFPGHAKGEIITDPTTVSAVLGGPYADQVRQVILSTGGGAGGNSITGVPSTIQAGQPIQGTYQAAASGYYVCVRLAGSDQLPRTALSGASGALPTLSATGPGTGTLAMYLAATGGAPLFETGAISFTQTPVSGIVLPPNALLLGTDAAGLPIVITLGAGLSLVGGVLSVTGSVPASSSRFTDDVGYFLADDTGGHLLAA